MPEHQSHMIEEGGESPAMSMPEPDAPHAVDRRRSPSATGQLIAWTTRFVVGLGMLAIAVGFFAFMRSSKPTVEEVDPAATREAVIVFEAARVAVQRQWRGYGTAEALNTADVPARVTATVESIPAEVLPGARVTQGQVLVQLDPSDFARQLEIAQQRIAEIDAALAQLDVEEKRVAERLTLEASDVAVAESDYERQQSFRQRNVGSQQDLDNAQRNLINARRSQLQMQQQADLIGPRRQSLEAQKTSQQSQVKIAELNQQRTTVLSPIDGVLEAIDVEVGENLAAGQTIARVVAPSPVEVPIRLPASSLASVGVGDRVTLRPTSGGGNALGWSTTLSRISPTQDATTRTLTVYADLSAKNSRVNLPVPGMFLEATVSTNQNNAQFIVPRRAIREGRVQVVRGGEVVSRPVEVRYNLSGSQPRFGLPDEQWAVIDDALVEGDLVVVNAARQLADGALVDPKPTNSSSPQASAPFPGARAVPGAP